MIGLGLSVVQLAVRQRVGGFNPASLFAASEPGVWLDPSDFSTMFQDAAGTTPVTAVEQPVGLMLDKSKGLVLGPERVTNGDFSNGTTGWSSSTVYTSTSSVVDGVFRVNSTTNYGLQLQPISCVVGKAYVITGQARRGTVTSAAIGASVNANGAAAIALATTTSSDFVALRCQFVATSTTMYIVLGGSAGNPSGYHEYDNISVRELPGNHATQATSTSRPVLQQDGNGKYYLRFDGIDDWLITPTITPGVDKAQVFAGVRKLSDAAPGVVAETSATASTNNGSLLVLNGTSGGSGASWLLASRGTAISILQANGYASPITNVLAGIGDISGDSAILRVNGAQAVQSTADQGAGNFLAYPLYIGRRGGTTLPFNGHLYGLVVRFGANLPAGTIASTETWLNGKTGAY